MTKPLTEKQAAIFEFIRGRIVRGELSPTVREIGQHFGIRSPNGVICHLRALEHKGCLVRAADISRGIQLADNPMEKATSLLRQVHDSGADLPEDLFREIDAFLQVKP